MWGGSAGGLGHTRHVLARLGTGDAGRVFVSRCQYVRVSSLTWAPSTGGGVFKQPPCYAQQLRRRAASVGDSVKALLGDKTAGVVQVGNSRRWAPVRAPMLAQALWWWPGAILYSPPHQRMESMEFGGFHGFPWTFRGLLSK